VSATVDRDQLRTLRALRYWFGDLEVLAVLEQEGAGEGNPPRLTGAQLALSIPDPAAQHRSAVQPGSSRPASGRRRA
jgi:hypothetical protein